MLFRRLAYVLFVLVATLAIAGCAGENKYVSLVKNGTMQMEPNIKIGKELSLMVSVHGWEMKRIVQFSLLLTVKRHLNLGQ